MKILPLKNSNLEIIVDDKHYDRLLAFEWWYIGRYVYRKVEGTLHNIHGNCVEDYISLSNEIFQTRDIVYDHKDRNRLNYSESNLRKCTQSQNLANRSKQTGNYSSIYKGVSWHKRASKWVAHIKVNGHLKYLGCFKIESDAAKAYNMAALRFFGEFAVLNTII